MDAAQLQSFEAACQGLHDPAPATRRAAEQALLEFRRSCSVEQCVAVLQQSREEAAQFQAVLALRESVLGRWAVLGRAEQQATLQFLLHLALGAAGQPGPLLRAQVHGAAAAIIKRGWLEAAGEEQAAPLHAIHALSTQAGTVEARRAGLQLLTAVVEEFSPATASTMGLSWELHEKCRQSLEEGFLRGLLLHGLACAREAAPAAAAGADGGVCLAALRLLSAALSWPFSRAGGSSVWRLAEGGRPVQEGAQLRPPASWRDALLDPQAWPWLAQLAQAQCQLEYVQSAAAPGSPLAALAAAVQRLVEQLAGLSGDVFGPPVAATARAELGLAPQASPKGQHLVTVLRMLLPWVAPPDAAVQAAAAAAAGAGPPGADERLLAACRALLAAAGVHRAAGFEAVGPALGLHSHGDGGGGGVLGLLAQLTAAVLRGSGPCLGGDSEAAELLLDGWLELVADPCRGPQAASPAAADAAATVFAAVVEQGLAAAALEAFEDDEEVEGGEGLEAEERLARAAALGRASAARSLPLLSARLAAQREALQGLKRGGCIGTDPSMALEQLCWLASMAAAVLADEAEGETPLPPLPVVAACEEAAARGGGGPDPALALSGALLAVGEHCLAAAGRDGASPRLMEVVALALARWADTYLMPEEPPPSPALAAAYGQQAASAAAAAHLLAGLALAALSRYPGERALHAAAAGGLLAAATRRAALAAALAGAPAWRALCEAVGRGEPGLLQLEGAVQRRLMQSLMAAAAGWPADAGAWATQLLGSASEQLRQLGSSEAAARAALQRADGLHLLASLLQRLRGALRGALPSSQPAVFQQFTSVAPALATLFGACSAQPAVLALILKLAAEVVEQHAARLAPPDARALCGWALQLLQTYSRQNLGQVSVAASSSLAAEALSERYRDLRALLKLLTRLTQADWAAADSGGGGAQDGSAVDVAEIVFAGLDVLVPLLSPELLKFPKLSRAYFALLAHMLEVYPERMAALPARVFHTLLSTLRFGASATGDDEVTQAVFEAAAALAQHHVAATAAGGPGLGPNNAPGPDGVTPLGSLLLAAMHRLLHGDAGLEAVDHSAAAVLPMALADPHALQRAGEALLAACADGNAQVSARASFSELAAQVGAAAAMDRPARRGFAKALARFVTDARGALNVR